MAGTHVYRLMVTLKEIKPPIWRRLLVRGDMSLEYLHDTIQIAFNWTDSHLHQFIIGGAYYEFIDEDNADSALDEEEYTVDDVLKGQRCQFQYNYDFGDNWEHSVVVEEVLQPEEGLAYPVCLAGARSAPPEDSGGPHFYPELLAALSDPEHEDHDELSEWAGPDFDPEAFDLEAINTNLAEAF